ncbi:MAG: dephospho-CoA kinase [Bdellovibrionales bacterium]|nr:dephospho-CoA kinase [Bdellovibrionales bacterium]
MKWVGLTGGIATGKSTVAKILRDLGLPVVDADYLSREVTRPGAKGYEEIVKHFGPGVLLEDGEINRARLGEIIFQNEDKRRILEGLLHPLIQERRAQERRNLEHKNCELAFYDVPLLFEKKLESEFDATVLVYSRIEEQKLRLKERDGLSDEQIEARLAAQLPIDEKLKLADYIILNHGNIADLKMNVQSVVKELQN